MATVRRYSALWYRLQGFGADERESLRKELGGTELECWHCARVRKNEHEADEHNWCDGVSNNGWSCTCPVCYPRAYHPMTCLAGCCVRYDSRTGYFYNVNAREEAEIAQEELEAELRDFDYGDLLPNP